MIHFWSVWFILGCFDSISSLASSNGLTFFACALTFLFTTQFRIWAKVFHSIFYLLSYSLNTACFRDKQVGIQTIKSILLQFHIIVIVNHDKMPEARDSERSAAQSLIMNYVVIILLLLILWVLYMGVSKIFQTDLFRDCIFSLLLHPMVSYSLILSLVRVSQIRFK